MKTTIPFFLAGCLLLVAACGDRTPKGVLPIDRMKVIMLHQMMAEELVNNYITRNEALDYDSAKLRIYPSVLALHKTDSATFKKSLDYYRSDIARFKMLMDSVNNYATRERDRRFAAEAAADSAKSEGQPADSTVAPAQ